METYLTDQPSALPAARVPVAHESFVGRRRVGAPPMPGVSVLPMPRGDHGTSVPTGRMTAGNRIAIVDSQFTGDARGVPPRGRPV